MKKNILFGTMLIASALYSQTTVPSSTENYVYSKSCLDVSCIKKTDIIQYFDGLGRPKQIVNVKASPQEKDIVIHIEYDSFGRKVKEYLPIPQAGTQNAAIYNSPLNNASAIYGQEKIYSEKILENSPLNRIQSQIQIGNDWNNNPIQLEYDVNNGFDVKKYMTTTSWSNNTSYSTVSLSGNYDDAELTKLTKIDEDGNKKVIFENKKGQIILERKNDGLQDIDTYYIYNQYNQLVVVVPPMTNTYSALTPTLLDQFCFQYRYDRKNRVVEKKLPGKGWEYMVYDKADRLILTQDANLEQQGKWMITKYDIFGRVAYTGILPGGSRISMQNQITNPNLVITEARDAAGFTKNGMQVYYTNGYFTNIQTVLSVNYYDTYPTGSPAVPAQILGQDILSHDSQNHNQSTKSLPTASYVKNIEDDNWTKTYIWYDKKGRAVGTHSINHLGGYTRTETELDFAGVPKQTYTYHRRLNTDTEKVIEETFTYDHQNRLLEHRHKVDSQPEEILAQNEYNELSQLTNKQVGNGLQSIDYQYNIRGWLTKINEPTDLNGKLFGFEIKYANPEDTSSRFNGNISEIDWAKATGFNEPTIRRYSYSYDAINRLTNANFSEPNVTIPYNGFYNESMSYDLNGNITQLSRNAPSFYGNYAEQIDELSYDYDGNRLITINDGSGNPTGYEGGGNPMEYDANGNMTTMPDRMIEQIDYNYLNLPTKLRIEGFNKSMTYRYRADGTKLKKSFVFMEDNGALYSSSTEYLDGFHYVSSTGDELWWAFYEESGSAYEPEAFVNMVSDSNYDNVLKFFPTAEGFYDFENNEYIYQYKDHLGNVRLSYKNDGNQNPIVTDSNDFYPFGMSFVRNSEEDAHFGTGSYKNYKFGDKELQEMGFYDFGARMYMPDIGRWKSIDPLAELSPDMTPYRFGFNNPVMFTDPTGMYENSYGGGDYYDDSDRDYDDDRDFNMIFFYPDEWNSSNSDFWNIISFNWGVDIYLRSGWHDGNDSYGNYIEDMLHENNPYEWIGNGQDPPNQSGPGSKQGSQSTNFPLQSPALNMDIPILAVPYMLAEAFVHTGVKEVLTRLGMDGRDADQLAQLASLAFGSKNFGKVAAKGGSKLKFPGTNPGKAPKGFEWKGKPGSTPGSKDGNWYNPKTGESLRPDLNHPKPIGSHWDYKDPSGKWWRIFPDGSNVPK